MPKLTGTTVVVNPTTHTPEVLLAGTDLPDWADGLVGSHLLDPESEPEPDPAADHAEPEPGPAPEVEPVEPEPVEPEPVEPEPVEPEPVEPAPTRAAKAPRQRRTTKQ